MKTRDVHAVFNRGRISKRALARTDLKRVALSAEIQTNWMPGSLGSMMLRPGLAFRGTTASGRRPRFLDFVYSLDDTALLELTPSKLRVWDNGDTLVRRPQISATIENPEFLDTLTGWTVANDSGATAVHSGDQAKLTGTGYGAARIRQQVAVAAGEDEEVHALRIVVARGPVLLRVGSTAGGDDVFRQAVLRTGTHSIAFTPGAGTFWIEFSGTLTYPVLIESCDLEPSGYLTLPTKWDTNDRVTSVRWHQSQDVVFCAASGVPQQRIERRPNNSWSVVDYQVDDGPFLAENGDNIRLTPGALSGETTLTATRPYFTPEHVGALVRLTSQGQRVERTVAAENVYTDPIRVSGVEKGRRFDISITGVWSGTVSLQRSVGDVGAWVTVATYTGNTTVIYDDKLDNSVIYYRLGIEADNFTSGNAILSLEFSVGSIAGICRVSGFTSETSVDVVVLRNLGGTSGTEIWAEGAWSDKSGWPDAVVFFGGRLWWPGRGWNHGSVPDVLNSFDPEVIGDSRPINRSIGGKGGGGVNWALPLQWMVVGTDASEHTIRSTSLDEHITQANYNAKMDTTLGSAPVPAVVSGSRGYFVDRTRTRIYEMDFDVQRNRYVATNMTLLVPEIGDAKFRRLAVQEAPDRRLHCVLNDGTTAVMVRDEAEDVLCWVDIETDGEIIDVITLPGAVEDRVFYSVRRILNGVEKYCLEEWAREGQCRGGPDSRLADSHIAGSQRARPRIGGLKHLEGHEVVVWADGEDRGVHTVKDGNVLLDEAVSDYCAGLGYSARFKSAKLAGETQLGLSLTQRSRINSIGLVLADTHQDGLKFGPDFDNMDGLPDIEDGELVAENKVWAHYDEDMLEFPGDWETDNRICLLAEAPRPCTVLAAVINIDRRDK